MLQFDTIPECCINCQSIDDDAEDSCFICPNGKELLNLSADDEWQFKRGLELQRRRRVYTAEPEDKKDYFIQGAALYDDKTDGGSYPLSADKLAALTDYEISAIVYFLASYDLNARIVNNDISADLYCCSNVLAARHSDTEEEQQPQRDN